MFPFKLPLRHRPQQLRVDSRQPSQVRASNRSSFRRALSDRTHVPCSGYDHFVLQLSQPAHPRRRHPCFQRDPAARHSAEDLIFFKHGNLLLHALDKPLATNLKAYSLLATHTGCPISPHVDGYPAGGPIGNNDWYANADRTIWAPFWGWDFVRRGPDELDPKTGYEPGQKVLWYKPSDALLIVTGRRIDGAAPPLGYDISRDPRPRGPIQPSGIYFPSVGCWEVDAKAGRSELRFVVLVKSGPL
jgi:hypothetical protein